MKILGIESSCDETSVSVVENGRKILSNIVLSQVNIHEKYGGVVPEIASRAHTEAIYSLTERALSDASVTAEDIGAVAVTYAPGLIGALLVGVNFAKAFAYKFNKPLVPVHHIRGHIGSAYLSFPELTPPFTAFVASGGHTSIIEVNSYVDFNLICSTRDDAAGEAFDKIARVMDIPYPGGKEIDRLASLGDSDFLRIPNATVSGSELDFSFSGIKTYIINFINTERQKNGGISEQMKADIAASFTKNVITAIISRLEKALELLKQKSHLSGGVITASGGVMANSHITAALRAFGEKNGLQIYIPPRELCGDNAAMIAAQGFYEFQAGHIAKLNLNAFAVKNIETNYGF